jgi:hypothetical protein
VGESTGKFKVEEACENGRREGMSVARQEKGFWRRHRWLKWVAGGLLVVLVALGAAISIAVRRAEPFLRAQIVEKLSEHFHARVELDYFHVSLVDGLRAEGKGLRIWPPDDALRLPVQGEEGTDATKPLGPLIEIAEFRFHAPLEYTPGRPITIRTVELKGLAIDVPPKSHFAHASNAEDNEAGPGHKNSPLIQFEVENVQCTGAHLTMETSKPGKLPLEFAIARVKLTHVSADGPMHFDAELTSPKPEGTIFTSGNMGRWATEDPGETPLMGEYRFEHADLGVFKGIAGILESTGKYQGALRTLVVDGQTDTPDFRLTSFGTPLPLHTQFHALVDGTNGDTRLEPVDAMLGHSHFVAEGQVVRVPAKTMQNGSARPEGHDIALKVNVDRGRIEDFLRLASRNGTPLMTGDVKAKSIVDVSPGLEPVQERLRLNGSFELADTEFTSDKIQNYVGQLSLRGQGRPKDAKISGGADVRSAMQSDFKMTSGVISLSDLQYTVPGAEIDVKGTYGVDKGALDFVGTARTQATVSQLVGGWKGFLLKPADRIFKKDGAGTEVPIHVNGTREDPHFGVDLKRMKHSSPEAPGGPR